MAANKSNSQIKKYINMATCPFRAVYATIATAIWEVLSFGVLTPYMLLLWTEAYKFMEINEK